MRMTLAGHQFPRALVLALGMPAAQEAAVVQEEPQQVQVRDTLCQRPWRLKLAVSPRPASIGIGGHLTMPPLPHHRAYGSVPRRFGGLSTHELVHGEQAQTLETVVGEGTMQGA